MELTTRSLFISFKDFYNNHEKEIKVGTGIVVGALALVAGTAIINKNENDGYEDENNDNKSIAIKGDKDTDIAK